MKKYSIIIALLLIVIGGNPAKAQQDRTQSIIHSSHMVGNTL